MLNVLSVLSDQGSGELEELLAQLGQELGTDQVLDGLLLLRVGVDVDVELFGRRYSAKRGLGDGRDFTWDPPQTHLPQYRGQPQER